LTVYRRALAFGDGPHRYILIQRFSKINILLTIDQLQNSRERLFYLV